MAIDLKPFQINQIEKKNGIQGYFRICKNLSTSCLLYIFSLPEAVNPIKTQYNQKSLNSFNNRLFGFFISGRRRNNIAITGISTPKFPAELDALLTPAMMNRIDLIIAVEHNNVPGDFSLALLSSKPSCTKSSKRVLKRLFNDSGLILAAILASAFITALDTCLKMVVLDPNKYSKDKVRNYVNI